MQQLKIILSRLKNPSVVLSIVSHTIIVIAFLKVECSESCYIRAVIIVCYILVLLGIFSNPSTKNYGYGDDILKCQNCKEKTSHIFVDKEFICSECGHKFEKNKN